MKKVFSYIMIVLGAFIFAVGLNVFLVPQKLSTGGVSGIGTVLKYVLNIPLSVTNIITNAFLFIFGFKLLGKKFVFKTVFGIVLLTVFLEITSYFPQYNGDIFSSFVAGSVFVGVGIGLVIRQGASTGGSDFSALIFHTIIPHVSIAKIMLIIDCIIVIFSGIIFKSLSIMIYSLAALYISSRISDYILVLGDNAKSVYIFSSENQKITNVILKDFQRGVTAIKARGIYQNKEKEILFCAVSPKELPKLIDAVKIQDQNAFVIINDVHKVLGEGFKSI